VVTAGRAMVTGMRDPKTYDLFMVIVVWLGLHQGVFPFAAKAFDWQHRLSLPLLLPSPLWWIVSALVVVIAFAGLSLLDTAKKKLPEGD
jgi:hypothetical protein